MALEEVCSLFCVVLFGGLQIWEITGGNGLQVAKNYAANSGKFQDSCRTNLV
jgi:hypothetical protein